MKEFLSDVEWLAELKEMVGVYPEGYNLSGTARQWLERVVPTCSVKLDGAEDTYLLGRVVDGNHRYSIGVLQLYEKEGTWFHKVKLVVLPNPSLDDSGNFVDNELKLTAEGEVLLRNSGRYSARLKVDLTTLELSFVHTAYRLPEALAEANRNLDMSYGHNVWECDTCNATLHDTDTRIDWEGEALCDSCSGSIITCNGCGVTVVQDDPSLRDLNCCDDCEVDTFGCHNCGMTHWLDDQVTVNGDEICQDCFSRDYITCGGCGDVHHRHQINGSRCNHCRPISSYGRTQATEFHGGTSTNFDSGRVYYGVELEVECGSMSHDEQQDIASQMKKVEKTLEFKTDGSLSNGFEIVSQPATMAYHEGSLGWQEILRIARSNGLNSHNTRTCGLHVHIGRGSLDDWTEIKLAYFVNMMEDFMVKFSRRNYGQWAHKDVKVLDQTARNSGRHGRYSCTNFSSQTIEIRMFKGTLKESTFMATVEFCDALVEFCRTHQVATFSNERDCVRKFIGYAERKARKYPHLYSYIVERSIDQHYSYTSKGRQVAKVSTEVEV